MQKSNDILHVEGVKSKGFGIIPKLVMQDRRLTRDAKAIYAYFCSYAGTGDMAFSTVSKICQDLCFGSKDTFRKHFKLLMKYDYIRVEQMRDKNGKFKRNVYILVDKPESKETEDVGDATDTQNLGDGVKLHEISISADTQNYGDGKIRCPRFWGTNNNNINNNNKININNNNNNRERNCLKGVKEQGENIQKTGNGVVVKGERKNKNISVKHENNEKLKFFKQKIKELTGEVVIERVLSEFLNEPGAEERLQHAIDVYDTISRIVLTANDIKSPVGLFFYVAKIKVQPPKGKRANNNFNNFEQHEYKEEELEILF